MPRTSSANIVTATTAFGLLASSFVRSVRRMFVYERADDGALVLAAAIEAPHLRDTRPLEPGVADTVAQLVWRL